MIPDKYDVVDKNAWLDNNLSKLTKPDAVSTGAGVRGAGGAAKTAADDLTPEEIEFVRTHYPDMNLEEYAKNK